MFVSVKYLFLSISRIALYSDKFYLFVCLFIYSHLIPEIEDDWQPISVRKMLALRSRSKERTIRRSGGGGGGTVGETFFCSRMLETHDFLSAVTASNVFFNELMNVHFM